MPNQYSPNQIAKAVESLRLYPDAAPADAVPDPELRELALAEKKRQDEPQEVRNARDPAPEPPADAQFKLNAGPEDQGARGSFHPNARTESDQMENEAKYHPEDPKAIEAAEKAKAEAEAAKEVETETTEVSATTSTTTTTEDETEEVDDTEETK